MEVTTARAPVRIPTQRLCVLVTIHVLDSLFSPTTMAAAAEQVELSTSSSSPAASRSSDHDANEINDDDSDPNEAEPEQDGELWYPDGNIILSAGNVHFRVYMGSLARHSPVFHDMFKIPQPPNTGEECPVVELWDSPHDLRHVLRLLMPAKTPR